MDTLNSDQKVDEFAIEKNNRLIYLVDKREEKYLNQIS